jgi:phage gp16-like protein
MRPSTKPAKDAARSTALKAVHASKRQLALDDDTYRDLLQRVTTKRSASELDAVQLRRVLSEMRRLGAVQPTQPHPQGRSKPAHYPGTPHNIDTLPAQIEVVEALLTEMRLSWGYADAIARRMFRVDKVAWLKDAKQVVAILSALYNEREKRALLADIELVMASGVARADLLAGLRDGWRRHLPTLKVVNARLAQLGLIEEAHAWHEARTAGASSLQGRTGHVVIDEVAGVPA